MFNSQEIYSNNQIDTAGQYQELTTTITGLGSKDLETKAQVMVAENTFDQSLDGELAKTAQVSVDLSGFNLGSETFDAIVENADEVSFNLTVTNKKGEEVGSCEVSGNLADRGSYVQPSDRMLTIVSASGSFKIGSKAGQIGAAQA